MARHSEDECAFCERDVLPLSYIVGEDQEFYCSVKCAEAGEKISAEKFVRWHKTPTLIEAEAAQL